MRSRYAYQEFLKGFIAGVLLVCVVMGVHHGLQHIKSKNESRNPAAIDKARIFDVSYLEGGALKTASSKQLLQNAEVVVGQHEIEVSLGHFLAKSPSGERQLLCEIYDQVELSFEADGMATNGERPRLVVTAPCVASENLNRMNPVRIPYTDILSQRAGDGEFTFATAPEHDFRTLNIGNQWPEQWILSEVKLVNKENPAALLQLDRRDVYNFSSRPIVLNWSK